MGRKKTGNQPSPYSKAQKKKLAAQEHNELREWAKRQEVLHEKFQLSMRGGDKSVTTDELLKQAGGQPT